MVVTGTISRPDITYLHVEIQFVRFWRDSPQWAMASSFTTFLDHTQRRTTLGRTPLDERSARRRDLYMTTHITHNRKTSMPPVRFETTILAEERPKTYALDRAATGTGRNTVTWLYMKKTQKYNRALGWLQQLIWRRITEYTINCRNIISQILCLWFRASLIYINLLAPELFF
jgi:hypothetical protein